MDSRLLDLRDCRTDAFAAIHRDMLALDLAQQPRWFRPLLRRSRALRGWTGYDHWSRAWEYPWAILAAGLETRPLRALDVGGGGSPFALYLAAQRHESHVADPSLDQGSSFVFDRRKSLYRNLRSVAKRLVFRAAGLHALWGLPDRNGRAPIHYHACPADRLEFPDGRFDRVFCLSVMEHVPRGLWPGCMREFQRVLAPGGRLVITLDMTSEEADRRLYLDLVKHCDLALVGDPRYDVPIGPESKQARHPGHGYETVGLVWEQRGR
ncbi:MAG TPA: class I SAM-dependent methyltransferase [Candidatus Dormibacteraeota bacterium]|nr:class I SAM-dependent methyltransferase [Candidatus Dormibacteraeota bacterium]